MTADWLALVEPWWPYLAAAALGVVLLWLMRRRTSGNPPAQPSDQQPTAFPVRVPAQPAPEAAAVSFAGALTPKPDAPDPFAMFETKLHEWQNYASSEAAVRAVEPPSIDDWDDLMEIEGIDIGLARFLYEQGVHTFEQIQAMTALELRAVLDQAGTTYANIDTTAWPDAARRAALAR